MPRKGKKRTSQHSAQLYPEEEEFIEELITEAKEQGLTNISFAEGIRMAINRAKNAKIELDKLETENMGLILDLDKERDQNLLYTVFLEHNGSDFPPIDWEKLEEFKLATGPHKPKKLDQYGALRYLMEKGILNSSTEK